VNKHQISKSFASDNYAGIHPAILQAIINANQGHASAYGADDWTQKAVEKFREYFGNTVDVHFVFNGTAANVLSFASLTKSINAIICAETAHIQTNECGAPEKFTGCKLFTIPTSDGKLSVKMLERYLQIIGDPHQAQPKIISITQATEFETVYTPEEIKAIADFAHAHKMFLHMDGARIANAAAYLNVSLKAITADVGVDVLSFGGTKNGLMCGEAVVFFNPSLSQDFKYIRKQGMQLASKMRFISAQYIALLSNDLWLKNAQHSNAMAQKFAQELGKISGITITQPVQANGVFAIIPQKYIAPLQAEYPFYVWNEATSEVRLMTSFDTTIEDIDAFVVLIKKIMMS